MKLRTKLIPLTSLALVSASIAPFSLSSCGSNKAEGKAYDLTKNYYPTIDRYNPEDKMSIHDVHQVYVAQLQNNLDTFVQDYFWAKSWIGTAFEQFYFWSLLLPFYPIVPVTSADKTIMGSVKNWYKTDIEVIDNLSMTTQEISYLGEDWVIPTLSFTLSFDSSVRQIVLDKYYIGSELVSGYLNGEISGSLKFQNVPFIVCNKTVSSIDDEGISTRLICFDPFYDWMLNRINVTKEAMPWSIKTEVVSRISGEISYTSGLTQRIGNDFVINKISSTEQPLDWHYSTISQENTVCSVFVTPYYLEKVMIK